MSTLISIGYPDAMTASSVADEARRQAADLHIRADAIAVISRDRQGEFHVTTNHGSIADAASWGMFWGLLFSALFFVPVTGLSVGPDLAAVIAKVQRSGLDQGFQEQVRDMLQPGASALFLVADVVSPDVVTNALSVYGGTVLVTSMTEHTEAALQRTLHGVSQLS